MEKEMSFVEQLVAQLIKNEVMNEEEASSLITMFHDRTKARVDYFLLDEGIVERDDLLEALAGIYQVPSFDAKGYLFDHMLLKQFPKDVLISNSVIPLQVDEDIMIMIASNPEDEDLIEAMSHYTSHDVEFNVGLQRDIIDAIEEYYEIDPISEGEEFQEDLEDDEIDDSDIVDEL